MRERLLLILAASMLTLTSAARADKPAHITETEMALLPAYCPDTQTFKYGGEGSNESPNAQKWVALMGRPFWTMHHYCWALLNLARAQKPTMAPNIRDATRDGAIGDMMFVIENSPPDFIMLPEIYTKIGEVQLLLKRPAQARDSFAKARTLKPDYWPPYFHWGEYLRQNGQTAQARELVAEGLSYSPDAKVLQRLLITLGGDPASIPRRSASPPADDSTQAKEPAK
jgi:tetratricopeptide (TPR) repeat protein